MGPLALPLLTGAMSLGSSLIERFFPDPEQANAAKLELLRLQQTGELTEMVEAAGIIKAEAQSEHWLTANWRPLTMLTFVVIIANNYIIYPYLSLFFAEAPVLEIPPDMWDLLKLGLGGYVVGRSAEKGIKAWKE
jgi:hypothetical protein